MQRKKKAKAASVAAINVTSKTGHGRGSHPKKSSVVESEIDSAPPTTFEEATPAPSLASSGGVPPQTERMNESTIELWKSVFDFEKNRYSFFDELFTQGHVVDSLEVLRSGPNEPTEHFVEAELSDYVNKTNHGRVVLKTKHMYTGNFEDWYFHGPGRYFWADGTVYEGEFRRGLMHGQGSIFWSDGSVYEGEFIDGERAPGWNIYTTAEGFTFAGDWQNGLPHGQGKIWYDPNNEDTDYYEGGWASGVHHGYGIRQYNNGDRYLGNWENGVRSGQGTMIWLQERQVYKGHWESGNPSGVGKHIWYYERTHTHVFPSRHVYLGDWVDGKREGIGKMINPCGSTYEGRWKDGQRHGKGIFLNPAGALVTGLFKNGSLIGGSDVPLHSPTYECDFSGLVQYLTTKFKLNLQDEESEEFNLTQVVERNLEPLRQLYQRAGELSHFWGNNGLYPHWLKENQISDPAARKVQNHRERGFPPHMNPKFTKPPSPDGVHPVTRFGLWLLLKDSPQLTKDVTLAYLDKHFGNCPSISFQTRHNPFEPVLLWQFLQCLIVVAVTLYLEIPEHKRKMQFPRHSYSSRIKNSDVAARASVSVIEVSESRNSNVTNLKISQRKQSKQAIRATLTFNKKAEKRKSKLNDKGKHPPSSPINGDDNKETESTGMIPEDGEEMEGEEMSHEFVSDTEMISKKGLAVETTPNSLEPGHKSKTKLSESTTDLDKNRRKSKFAKNRDSNKSVEPEPLKEEQQSSTTKKNYEWEGEVSSESDESVWVNSPGLKNPKPFKLSISKAFENFLADNLIPSLTAKPGKNLPEVPNPLPPLSDLFDAFQQVNSSKEFMSAQDFMRSMVDKTGNFDEIIYWHRSPEILSMNVNMDEFFNLQKQIFADRRASAVEVDELTAEGSFLGRLDENATISEIAKKIFEHETDDDLPKEPNSMDFLTDPLPFSEEDLPSQTFLWKDEPKLVPIEKTINPTENLQSQDVINVLRALYPNLVRKENDTNIHFDMIFCDWLWAIALCARISVDREDQPLISVQEEMIPDSTAQEGEKDANEDTELVQMHVNVLKKAPSSSQGLQESEEKEPKKKEPKSKKKKDKESKINIM